MVSGATCCLRFNLLVLCIVPPVRSQQTVPDNVLGPRIPNCPEGTMDITKGHAYWWECALALTCPGSEPWTRVHCLCACVSPDEYWAFWKTTTAPAGATQAPVTQAPVTGAPAANPLVPVVTVTQQTTQQPNGGSGNIATSGSGSGQVPLQQNNGGSGMPSNGASGNSNSGASVNGDDGGLINHGSTLAPTASATTDDDGISALIVALIVILTLLVCICIIVLAAIAYVKGIVHRKIHFQFAVSSDKIHPEVEESETVTTEAERAQQLVNELQWQLDNKGLFNTQESAFAQPVLVDVSPRGAEQRALAESRRGSLSSVNSPNNSGSNSPRPSPEQHRQNSRRPSLMSNVSQVSGYSQRSQNLSPHISPPSNQQNRQNSRRPSLQSNVSQNSRRSNVSQGSRISQRSQNLSPTAVQASTRGFQHRGKSPRGASPSPRGALSNERGLSPDPKGTPRATADGGVRPKGNHTGQKFGQAPRPSPLNLGQQQNPYASGSLFHSTSSQLSPLDMPKSPVSGRSRNSIDRAH